jgi:predicted peptidase
MVSAAQARSSQRDEMTSTSARLQAVTNPSGYDYLLSLPEKYLARPRWPLLLFLHGAGQRGADVWLNTQQGLPRLLADPAPLNSAEQAAAAKLASSFIVVAPQCPPLEVWEDNTLLALLDDVSTTLKIDPARVYLTGLSMGGFGAWSLGIRHPRRFAALVPICGGGRVADVTAAQPDRKTALRQLSVWAFHGAKDRVVPLEESERMVAALKLIGAEDVRLTVYPDVEHDAWTAAYANGGVYDWLLTHAR